MTTTIAVLTCDRPKGLYLPSTLRQIDREGGEGRARFVYVDGDEATARKVAHLVSREVRASGNRFAKCGWHVLPLGACGGNTEAMRRLLVDVSTRGTDLLFFEDDLSLCTNAVARMLDQPVPRRVGVVSFFDMKELRRGSMPGLYRRPANGADGMGLWGAQALKFPAEVVAWLAARDWNALRLGFSRMASDQHLGELVSRHPGRDRVAIHVPNLVQHIGQSSACFPGAGLTFWRRASNFPGREFDALSLPPLS